MAMWSKALPLTASACLSPLSGFDSHLGACEKVAGDSRLAVDAARYSGSLHKLELASHDWQKKS